MAAKSPERLVYLIWSYLSWGGAQIYFLSLVRNAPPGYKFRILLPRGVNRDIIEFFEAYGTEFEFLSTSFDLVVAESLFSRLKRQWKRVRVETEIVLRVLRRSPRNAVVHIEAGPWQSWLCLYLLARSRRVFVTVHNTLPKPESHLRQRLWSKRLNSLLDLPRFGVFAANQNALDSLKEFVRPDLVHKLTLTRATFDRTDVAAAVEKPVDRGNRLAKFGVAGDAFVVLCVGQFIDRKGRWIFLAAARELIASRDIQFIWVGPTPPTPEEQARVDDFGLGKRFTFIVSATLGDDRTDVLSFFRVADLFVLPSLWEGLPISILEAMALGLPVISTNINAIPEAITDGETGLLVKPGDAGELAAAISRCYSDDELRTRLGKAATARAFADFDEKSVADLVFQKYEA